MVVDMWQIIEHGRGFGFATDSLSKNRPFPVPSQG